MAEPVHKVYYTLVEDPDFPDGLVCVYSNNNVGVELDTAITSPEASPAYGNYVAIELVNDKFYLPWNADYLFAGMISDFNTRWFNPKK